MSNIYGPILPLQLDSRNTEALVRAIQTRIFLESDGSLSDFTPASPLSAIVEGQAFAQAELLLYLNNLPEAFSLQWLRQLGIQRKLGSRALADVTFYKTPGYQRTLLIPRGTKLFASTGQGFITLQEVRIAETEDSQTIPCQSDRWGSAYNVGAGEIVRIEKTFAGLDFIRNELAATGGTDTESVNEMKQRAFEVLSRRNLTTSNDFENEVRTLVPDSSIVKVLTYEERANLGPPFSGSVVICVGDENGKELGTSNLAFLIDSIKPRVTIGTNISIIPPNIVPVDLVLEVYYDPMQTLNTTSDALISELFATSQSYLDPANLGLGKDFNYQDFVKTIYQLDFVKSVNTLDIKMMQKAPDNLDGICAGFVGTELETSCSYAYSTIVNSDNQLLTPESLITSYKLYRAQITITTIDSFSPLTFTYEDLYTV